MEDAAQRSRVKRAGDALEDEPPAESQGAEASRLGLVVPETPDSAILDDVPAQEPLEKVGKINMVEMYTMG